MMDQKSKGKVLMVACVPVMIKHFNMPNIRLLQGMGYQVDVAFNCLANEMWGKGDGEVFCRQLTDEGIRTYQIDFTRSAGKITKHMKAYRQLKELVEKERYDFIHCHTPIAAAIARAVAHRTKTRVIYTAHGFHFYKGSPLKNWLIYYPVEWVCARWTDILVTINQEDYTLAKKHMHAREVVYVPGVGIDLSKFGNKKVDQKEKRTIMIIPDGKVWALAVGELIPRKNHENLIRAIADIPDIYLTIAGHGELQGYLTDLIRDMKLEDRVSLLGFRNDISELCEAADIFCMPSFQEGLPVALMEAMACGKPCVASKIRGNTDLIDDKTVLFDPHDVGNIREVIGSVLKRDFGVMGEHNAQVVKNFDLGAVMDEMKEIYDKTLIDSVGGGILR